jgi:uncharacterized protein YbbK (DUF523 family)
MLPRVGVSACLLGRPVRYDGSHRRSASLVEELSASVDLVPTCPEVDVGMGTPREPIALRGASGRDDVRVLGVTGGDDDVRVLGVTGGGDDVRVFGVASGRDWTAALREHAVRRVGELSELGLDGYVLKSRSPSCGLTVAVDGRAGAGRGVFAAELTSRLPALPVVEEDALEDPARREAFLSRVLAHARARGIRSAFRTPTPE